MNSNTYITIYPQSTKYAWGEVVNPTYDENNVPLCPICKGFISGMRWIQEKVLEIRGRKNLPDFLYVYGTNMPFVISENALTVLKKNSIKGIINEEKIDKIILKKESANCLYYMVELERCVFPIDYTLSKFIFGKEHYDLKCKLCNPLGRTKNSILKLCFDSKAKTDMDIFKIYEMGDRVFFSERFIKICKENNLTGLSYENVSEYSNVKNISE